MAESDVQLVAELPGDLVPEKDPALEKTRQGGFADVVRGRWTRPDGVTVPVAIKYLRTVVMQKSRTPAERVLRVNKVCWSTQHVVRNVTHPLGVESE